MLLYPATIRPDGDTYVVLFPDIPLAHTNGDSREDASKHAPDALPAAISMLMEKKRKSRPRVVRGGKTWFWLDFPR